MKFICLRTCILPTLKDVAGTRIVIQQAEKTVAFRVGNQLQIQVIHMHSDCLRDY